MHESYFGKIILIQLGTLFREAYFVSRIHTRSGESAFPPRIMNRKTILLFWISLGTLFSFNYVLVDSFVGINWGRMATQQLVPSMVVDLLLQNGIPELKLFSPSTNVLPAFANSSIGLSVTFQDFQLRRMNNSKDIYDWVGKNVKKHVDNGVDIRFLYTFSKLLFFILKYLTLNISLGDLRVLQSGTNLKRPRLVTPVIRNSHDLC